MSTEEEVVFVVVAEGRRRRNLGGWVGERIWEVWNWKEREGSVVAVG